MRTDMSEAVNTEDSAYPGGFNKSAAGQVPVVPHMHASAQAPSVSVEGVITKQPTQNSVSPAANTNSEHIVPVSGQSVSSFLRKYGQGIDTARVIGSNRIAQIWADSQEPSRKVLKNRWHMNVEDYRRRVSRSTRGGVARQKQIENSLAAQQANWRSLEAPLQQAVVRAQASVDTTKSRSEASHYPSGAVEEAQANYAQARIDLKAAQNELSTLDKYPETLELSIGLVHGPKANTSRLKNEIVDIDYKEYIDSSRKSDADFDTSVQFLRSEIKRIPWFWDYQAGASLEALEKEFEEDEHATFGLLLENGENVGFIYYGSAKDSHTGEIIPDTLELKYFGLYKDTQGKKYGQIFLDIAVQDMFQRTGIENVTLLQSHTNPKNVGRFYFHFGFSLDSIEETASFIPLWATTVMGNGNDQIDYRHDVHDVPGELGYAWGDPVI